MFFLILFFIMLDFIFFNIMFLYFDLPIYDFLKNQNWLSKIFIHRLLFFVFLIVSILVAI